MLLLASIDLVISLQDVASMITERLIDWDVFKDHFFEMFFPTAEKNKLMARFLALEHRGLLIGEYDSEFTLPSRYKL